VSTLTQLRKQRQLTRVLGDLTGLGTAERAALETAFGHVKQIVARSKKMDEATALRFLERYAAERAGGQGAFEALIEDMRAWRPLNQAQREADTALHEASELVAALREERAKAAAALRAGPKTPSGAVDEARIKELRNEIEEVDGAFTKEGKRASEGQLLRALENLRKAEKAAETARIDPVEYMRRVFNASRERAAVKAADAVDKVGPLRLSSGGLEVDHVVSLRRMTEMTGFEKLRPSEVRRLAVLEENLVLMDAAANSSKGQRSWSAWRQAENYYTDPATLTHWSGEDARLTGRIQEWILKTVAGR
jgi:hypothetical protein